MLNDLKSVLCHNIFIDEEVYADYSYHWFAGFKSLPADVKIDTSNIKPQEVYKIVLRELKDRIAMCDLPSL